MDAQLMGSIGVGEQSLESPHGAAVRFGLSWPGQVPGIADARPRPPAASAL